MKRSKITAILSFLLIAIVKTESASIKAVENAVVTNKEILGRSVNELTQEELFIKTWSNYIGLWTFLIGTFVLPTFITMYINPIMGRQTRDLHEKLKNIGNQEILNKLSSIEGMWQNLDVNDPMCRKRIICEVYSGQSPFGLTNKDMIQTVYHLSLRMPLLLRKLHREHTEAMSVGKQTRDCSRYASCAYYFIGHK